MNKKKKGTTIMLITNQKPVMLHPNFTTKIDNNYSPTDFIKESIIKPLYTPLISNQPINIQYKNNDITADELLDIYLNTQTDTYDADSSKFINTLFEKSLIYYQKSNLPIRNIFLVQASLKEKLPLPSASIAYTIATDVKPAAKQYIIDACTSDYFFASLGWYAKPNTLGFSFINESIFEKFKSYVDNQVQVHTMNNKLSQETINIFNDFQQLSLKNVLTESILLRENEADNNEEYSFARMIIHFLLEFDKITPNNEFSIMAFDSAELFHPKSIVFINVFEHSQKPNAQIKQEWEIINQSLQQPIKLISPNKISKLTKTIRQINKIQQSLQTQQNSTSTAQGLKNLKFNPTKAHGINFINRLKKLLHKMGNINKSHNAHKFQSKSFNKANRRDPMDFTRPGIINKINYKPDIHIYLDTSGSISEDNYQQAIKSCIQLAKKFNVDLYFNSFSHILSTVSKIKVKDKTTKQVYKNFQKIEKVTGGTDYQQIWNYINASQKRKKELSIIITDFEWTAPTYFIEHPKNLYYAPCSNINTKSLTMYAEKFKNSMYHNDSNIRKKILM